MDANDQTAEPLDSFDMDPQTFRRLGYQVIDLMADAVTQESSDPVMPQVSGQQMRAIFDDPVPEQGVVPEKLIRACRETLLQYDRKNGHPRFFGYVCASADPLGALADALASVLNQNVTAWRSAPAATEMERLVVRWLDEMVAFRSGGQGLLVGGGSAANTTAIACALATVKSNNEKAPPRDRLSVYRSTQGHLSIEKAARLFGVPQENVRAIDVDAHYRMIPEALDRKLSNDLRDGLIPACVCASAGTANTGAIDPLLEIAEVCRRHRVWFHIDGAYGAPAAMTSDYHWMQDGFAQADSMSLDPHKWLFAPLDVGCVLFRDETAAAQAFSLQSEYTAVSEEDGIERYAFFNYGLELSRRFRALKVWMILKGRGVRRITRMIEQNISLRRYLDARIAADPRLEALGSDLSISCFRYHPAGPHTGGAGACEPAAPAEQVRLNALNRKILETLVAEGRVYMSPTTLGGRYALRVCIVNFRTMQGDINLLVDEVLRIGAELCS